MTLFECKMKAQDIAKLNPGKKIIFDVKVPGGYMALRWLDPYFGHISEPEPTGFMTFNDLNTQMPNLECSDLRIRD